MTAADVKAIRSRAPRWALGLANLLAAGIATFSNDRVRALQELKAAASALDAVGIVPHRQAALYRYAQFETGSASAGPTEEIEAWTRREGVTKPAKLFAALAPGLWPS